MVLELMSLLKYSLHTILTGGVSRRQSGAASDSLVIPYLERCDLFQCSCCLQSTHSRAHPNPRDPQDPQAIDTVCDGNHAQGPTNPSCPRTASYTS